MDRGAYRTTIHGVAQSQTQLSVLEHEPVSVLTQ